MGQLAEGHAVASSSHTHTAAQLITPGELYSTVQYSTVLYCNAGMLTVNSALVPCSYTQQYRPLTQYHHHWVSTVLY